METTKLLPEEVRKELTQLYEWKRNKWARGDYGGKPDRMGIPRNEFVEGQLTLLVNILEIPDNENWDNLEERERFSKLATW